MQIRVKNKVAKTVDVKTLEKLDKLKTDHKLKETLCVVIADWMENNKVEINEFPQKYHDTLITQETIGWSHMFAGHISQEWIKLFEESMFANTNKNQHNHSYLWSTSVVEVILSEFVCLWEIRNKEVHGKTKERNETLRKKKLTIETKRLNPMKDETRPGNQFLFHDSINEFTEKSSAKRIGSGVCSFHNAIKNSVKIERIINQWDQKHTRMDPYRKYT